MVRTISPDSDSLTVGNFFSLSSLSNRRVFASYSSFKFYCVSLAKSLSSCMHACISVATNSFSFAFSSTNSASLLSMASMCEICVRMSASMHCFSILLLAEISICLRLSSASMYALSRVRLHCSASALVRKRTSSRANAFDLWA